MMLLHAWDVAGNDILPMVQAYHSGAPDLILDAVKLLVFLTLPADPGALNFNAQRHHINRTVEALTRNSCAVVFSHLAEPLERFESSRLRSRDEDGKTIQLFLTFIRNLLLSYHDNSPYNAASSSHNVDSKSGILTILIDLHLPDLLCQIAKDARKKPFVEDITLLIEIFHLLFQFQDPSSLIQILAARAGTHPRFNEGGQNGERKAFTLNKKLHVCSRHGSFGGKTIHSYSLQRTRHVQAADFRNYYGVHVSDSSKNKSLTAGAVTQLAELAQTFLDGGFNEIVFVACDLMKQRDLIISNEDLLNVHSFLALLHFFVSFVSLGVDGNLMDISESCTLSNLFDKHVFYWLKRTWELFDQNKDVRGLLYVSALVKEMLVFMEKITARGSQADKFVCQALTADVLWAEGHDGYLHFCNSLVKRYDSKCLPMIYLADCIEVAHMSKILIRQIDPKLVALNQDLLNERSVSNYTSLLAFPQWNSPRLNSILFRCFEDVENSELEGWLYGYANLQIIHAIAVSGGNKFATDKSFASGTLPVFTTRRTGMHPDGYLKLKDMATSIIVSFMQKLYLTKYGSASDYKRKKHMNLTLI